MIGRWIVLLALALLAGACTDARTIVDPDATAIEITTQIDPSLGLTQIRIADADETRSFDGGMLPDEPRALAGEQTMMILLPESLDGRDLVVRIDGLAGDTVVSSGGARVTVRAHHVVPASIALGAPAICGDGKVADPIEACDDANQLADDGCSAGCYVEPGFVCTVPAQAPSTCRADSFEVASAISMGNRTIAVTFTDPPDPVQALVLANYAIPGLDPSGIPFLSGSTVTLATGSQAAIAYNVLVSNVTRAKDGKPLGVAVTAFTGRAAFDVRSARSTSATKIAITFSELPTAGEATTLASYTVSGLSLSGVPVLEGNTVTIGTANQAARDYTVAVAGVTRQSDGEHLETTSATFTGVNGFDLAGAESTSNRQITVTYNAPPDPAQATTLGNYSIPGLALSGTPTLVGSTVTIATASQTATTYTVTVGNVTRATDGQALSNTVAGFTGSPIVPPAVTGVEVSSTTPNNGSTAYNTGTTTVRIIGSQFTSVVGVKLDDPAATAATSWTVDSDTQLTATFAAGIRTNGDTGWNVIVTNAVGSNVTSEKLVMRAGLLISEVYVASQNNHEFVELYNPTATSLSATALGLHLHVRNASGSDSNKPLTITHAEIASHGFLLIASSQSNNGDVWFAKRDATYAVMGSGIVANGGLYLSLDATANTQVLDRAGWGTQPAGGFEGAALANIPNGQSAERFLATDTDNNAADFAPPSTTLTPRGTADGPQP